MRTAISLIFLSFILISCTPPAEDAAEKAATAAKPNIIYIMADDLGIGDVGVYGQQIIETPHIDRLAHEGITFTSHYAGTSVCAPSRCVLMTGQHMGHAEVRGNRQWEPSGQMPISDSTITVAEVLKEAGYVTGMIGKWGLGNVGTSGAPLNQGWDFFYGYTDQVLAHNYWPEFLIRNNERVTLDNVVKYLDSTAWHGGLGSYSTEKVDYSNDLFTEEALSFINRNQDTSFFLYLPYTIPHNNGEALPGEKQEVPTYDRFDSLDWPSERKGYAAMIERLDRYVGKLTSLIDSLDLDERTLIIFTSDNGPMQERVGFTRFFDSNGIYRGGKRDLFEGGIRMPFIARWTGKITPGSVSDHQSYFTDFLATACEVAEHPVPGWTDGISYLPALMQITQPVHEYLYWEFHEQGKSQAIRRGHWKALRNDVFENPDAQWELYNLEEDPSEENDLAETYPETLNELIELAEKAHRPDPNWPLFSS